MSFFEVILIAFGLASDAFAVSVSAGAAGTTQGRRSMLRLSFHFGLFQFFMPLLGWLAGLSIVQFIQTWDHWIAFGLLSWVSLNMIRSACTNDRSFEKQDPSRGVMLVILSVATSLDALAIGLSLAMLRVSIWYPAIVIGVITGIASFLGILLGQRFSKKLGKYAAIVGGSILFVIGLRILLAHLFNF